MRKKLIDGKYVLTREQRNMIIGTVIVEISIKEMEAILKEAKKFSKSALMKKHPSVFFKHLSKDVSFMFRKGK
jgi:hypothetical protein